MRETIITSKLSSCHYLSNYFLTITKANIPSVVCLHKILILDLPFLYMYMFHTVFIYYSIWFYQCSSVLSSKLSTHNYKSTYRCLLKTHAVKHITLASSKWHPIRDDVICWYPYYTVTTILL